MKIEGKCALVTGGANGIGLNIVRNLLKRGAKRVVILDYDTDAGSDTQRKLGNEYGKTKIFFFPCDVSNFEELEENFKKSVNVCQKVDIFVNNSGIFNEADWSRMIDINVKGLVKNTKLALDYMEKSESNGRVIVNVASIAGLVKLEKNEAYPVYTATKYAVIGFSEAIKQKCDEKGIRLLIICPGAVKTNVYKNYVKTLSGANMTKPLIEQTPEQVGFLIVDLIEKNEKGTTWVIEDNKPPYAVELPHYSNCKV